LGFVGPDGRPPVANLHAAIAVRGSVSDEEIAALETFLKTTFAISN
jgi:hypothetical protein